MVLVTKGDFIWVDTSQPSSSTSSSLSSPSRTRRLPIGARVIDSDKGRLKVIDDQGREEWLEVGQKVKLMHPSSVQGTEDMIQLGDLHESAILRNICIRYNEKLIYTYTGSILIALNPYTQIPIYGADEIRMYRRRRIGELPPHIFAIADNAYTSMRVHRKDQSVVISGESGAGKTESTKLVLQFLAAVSSQHSWIEQQILEANPILEAFGNAKTIRNDNSSRFGKYIDIHFNQNGAIEGARIEHYLLEKSRIVSHSTGERNYHIFYCLCSGLTEEEKKSLYLSRAADFYYLNQGKCPSASRNDASDLSEIRSAMKVLLFKEEEISSIFRLLSAVLHIGNIKFSQGAEDAQEGVSIVDPRVVKIIAKLLSVEEEAVTASLTTKTLSTQGDIVISALTPQGALDVRDALAKGIYGRLFEHVNSRINDTIYKPKATSRLSIGVLDIFGFEAFATNSFEQLCINYANEALQQFFVRHVFKMEQHEYDQEKINWSRIAFEDNQTTLDLIAAKPMNILSLIDEESIFPKGTDSTLLSKLHATYAGSAADKTYVSYLRPKSDLQKAFGIRHYAGNVMYSVRGFLDKNRDSFSADLMSLIASSKFRFLINIFDTSRYDVGTANRRKGTTVGSQFRKSLDQLMTALSSTEPFFVRCIKPNEDKLPLVLDRPLVVSQLRNSGMLDAIRIRRAGYPIRHTYDHFVARYRVLVRRLGPTHSIDKRRAAEIICMRVLGDKADFALGETKVFLKDAHELKLEQEYFRRLNDAASKVQAHVRGWLRRREYKKEKEAAVRIQAAWRGYTQRERYKKMVVGFTRLQAILRSKQLVAHYNNLRDIVTALQAHCRGSLVRKAAREQIAKRRERSVNMAEVTPIVESRPIVPTVIEVEKESQEQEAEMVNDLFDFLPTTATNGRETHLSEEYTDSKLSPPFDDSDLSSYDFSKFAATYFQGAITSNHVKRMLNTSLLHHDHSVSQQTAVALWITTLRFMGDLPDLAKNDRLHEDTTPVMSRLYQTLGRKNTRQKENAIGDQGSITPNSRMHRAKKLISMTLKKSSKLKAMENASLGSADSNDGMMNTVLMVESQYMSSLDKLHFIIGAGILRPELRDEIYSQLCKQLTHNPSKLSNARGWILMSLCVGCFAPSEKLIKYLLHFVRTNGPAGYADYVEQRLLRTLKNGTRRQPPSYIELQANKAKKPIVIAVTLMDGTVRTVQTDSASTSAEVCNSIAEKVGIQERFGFSLYIALYDKVSSLGAGEDHVLDAISQCEQYAKEQGRSESTAPWRLFFRKEIFAPWHDAKEDPVSTSLIYEQIVRGIRYGEYRCDKEEDLALLCAQQFRVQEESLKISKLEEYLPKFLPEFEINNNSHALERWLQMVMHAYRKKFCNSPSSSPSAGAPVCKQSIKEEVVSFAKYKWPLLFSRFYEAHRVGGPPLPRNEVIIAVNWTGVYVVDDGEEILVEYSFPEIAHVVASCEGRSPTGASDTLAIGTIAGEEYIFESANADDVKELIEAFLQGLKRRSRYLVAVKSQKEQDDELEIERGDLLILSKGYTGEMLLSREEVRGENSRSGLQGRIKSSNVYVLPTMTRPTAAAMDMFPRDWLEMPHSDHNGTMRSNRNALAPVNVNHAPYTLESFAYDHFKATAPSAAWARTLTLRRKAEGHVDCWRFSREPLRSPLLLKLHDRQEPSAEAVVSFANIMKYMGDMASRRNRIGTDLTDAVFSPALKYEVLRDELYCQLMKQLTHNPSIVSEERGWELMWLATGLVAPGNIVYNELVHFLRSRPHPISWDCVQRLNRIIKIGSRHCPPHQVEVDAIQRKTTHIYHKVFFPDQSEDAIEVSSTTRSSDLIEKIAVRLGLKSHEGFALFIKFADRVLSVPEEDFFFDFVRQLADFVTQSENREKQAVPSIGLSYQVFFMRKLWLNATPGMDRVADLVFHFHQELPKYLHGYHSCNKEDSVIIAALLLRARTREGMAAPLAQLSQLLPELVPKDQLKAFSNNEWKKHVSRAYEGMESTQPDDAKVLFLNRIAHWPTFGSAFFPVRQSSDPSLPDKILVSINRNGLYLLNVDTKNVVVQYPFTAISNWTAGNTYFHVSVGNVNVKSSRLLLETSMGYKMDDLLTSYLSVLIGAQTRNPRLAMENQPI